MTAVNPGFEWRNEALRSNFFQRKILELKQLLLTTSLGRQRTCAQNNPSALLPSSSGKTPGNLRTRIQLLWRQFSRSNLENRPWRVDTSWLRSCQHSWVADQSKNVFPKVTPSFFEKRELSTESHSLSLNSLAVLQRCNADNIILIAIE